MEGPAPECLPLRPPRPCHLEAEFFHPLLKTTSYFIEANFSATFRKTPPVSLYPPKVAKIASGAKFEIWRAPKFCPKVSHRTPRGRI